MIGTARRRGLTLREARVARLVAGGRSDAEIADRLDIAVIDVDADLAAVLRKLGLRSRTEVALLMNPAVEKDAEERRINVDRG